MAHAPQGIRYTVREEYPDWLKDESRYSGQADSISFPADERELREHLAWAAAEGLPVTVQGARTGITGGAVPDGGHVLSLWRMRRIRGLRPDADSGGWLLRVEPGVLLSDVRDCLQDRAVETAGWSEDDRAAFAAFERGPTCFFPPDLTEMGASIGGLAANNGSGARSFRYGAARNSIQSARIVLPDGDLLTLARGGQRVEAGRFAVTTASGRELRGLLPVLSATPGKCVCGYYLRESMDVLDLFIGSEGTLGVFAELELKLLPAPAAVWGVTCFLPSEAAALDFVEQVRDAPVRPAAIEYIDCCSLDLLRCQRDGNPAFGSLPALAPDWHTAVYVEYHADSPQAAEEAVLELSERMTECGGDPGATWLADCPRDIDRFKAFRHAVPECVNLLIDERRKKHPSLVKLGTDLAVPDAALRAVMRMYRRDLEARGLEHVIFGHIGDNHVHVNIIPRSPEDYATGRTLYREWARQVVALGGAVSGEHGIGKLKRELLLDMLGEDGLEALRAVKRIFDPDGRLGQGNLWA